MNRLWLGAVLGGAFVLGLGYHVILRSERAIDRAVRYLSE